MFDEAYFKKYIATIPGFPKPGIMFRDVTPTTENPEAFKAAIDGMAEIASKVEFDKIICGEARGFLFGAALGYKMGKGVVCARKPGKLPRPGYSYSYTLEYGQSTLIISEGSIKEGERCLIVDDLIGTGGTAVAMMKLVEMSKAIPVMALFYVGLPDLKGDEVIKKENDIPVHSLVDFEGE